MLKKLLSSRKFVAAMIAVLASLVTVLFKTDVSPELQEKLVNGALMLLGLYVGGTALEDAAAKLGAKKVK